jgi:muramoyltetrapeptide carboxypeptidase LdcA involved in peptidoglycan recycling
LDEQMDAPREFKQLATLSPGDRVAVLSPSFAAPGIGPAVHEQAMRRLTDATGLIPVEYPTTRQLGASPQDRARDLNAAFADESIGAILATTGGDDQVTVIPFLDKEAARSHPKPFLGYSDNTNLLNWLWGLGIPGFYGGSTQVHLGAGPGADEIHLLSLRAALLDGGELQLTEPGESEDYGPDWQSPESLVEFGRREPTEAWTWSGPQGVVSGRSWGGCIEVIEQVAMADRMPSVRDLAGTILLLESSEEVPPTLWVKRWVRSLGERGLLDAVAGVLVARPPSALRGASSTGAERAHYRDEQRDAIVAGVARYNPRAVVCVGVPFGHTRPQWIVPYGGTITLDARTETVTAGYR